jgi:[glutamine synthetase] adenylyltransferase / [glutamine synthetase]-adenylyl-L-tyrosine phosphorylase
MVDSKSSSLSELARLGFEALSETVPKLERLVKLVGDRGHAALAAIASSSSPDRALDALIRLAEIDSKTLSKVIAKHEQAERLCRVLAASNGLADFLLRHPHLISVFTSPSRIPSATELSQLDTTSQDALKISYLTQIIKITDFDLGHQDYKAPIQAVTAALSDLAAGALEGALAIARREVLEEARFGPEEIEATELAIIAMGKCGARELNYVSDVDVIYVVAGDGDNVIEIGTRLATKLARIISEPSLEPGLWQVDPNLRPEGKSGALVRRLDAHLSYYQKWAEDWEFQALLKARFVAGSKSLGLQYEELIKPLVWQRTSRAAIVENARNMRKRVLDLIPSGEKDREIKLGRGGLRDVEFTAQLLQLVHGVTDESVRVPDTLSAVAALSDAGLIGRGDAEVFTTHYQTLRAIEHRVQLSKLRRDHLIPIEPSEHRRIARGLGLSSDDLNSLWQRVRSEVAALHDSVFYRPLLTAMASLSPNDVQLSDEEVLDRLSALGFSDPKGAISHISALTSGVSRRAVIQRTLLPVLLRWMAEGIDPDRALVSFRRLSETLGETHWFLRMLRDSSGAAERLMRVLSSSAFIARMLEHIPDSSVWFSDEDTLIPLSMEVILDEMSAILERSVDTEQSAEAIRQVRRREVLRIASSAVLGATTMSQIAEGLTAVTDAYLISMVELAKQTTNTDLDFGVISMGRWGGMELGFGSDADGMLVYLSDKLTAQAEAEKLTQVLLALSKDSLLEFELDLDLRPEGKNGPRVRSVAGYAGYYERWAEAWEFQALLRARVVVGSAELAERVTKLIDIYRYPKDISKASLIEIRRIKARVEAERLPQGANPARHLKLGRGSISDVEWLVQLLQLQHADKHPELQTTSTSQALEALKTSGIVPAEDIQRLAEGWLIASRCRSAEVLASDKRTDQLPSDIRQLEAMARILEYLPGESQLLEEAYLSVTRKARISFEKLFA